MINKTLQEIEGVPFYEGKKGLGVKLKSTVNEYLDLQKKFQTQFDRECLLKTSSSLPTPQMSFLKF